MLKLRACWQWNPQNASKNDFVLSLRKIVYVFIGLSNDYQLMIDTTISFSVLRFNFTQIADITLTW